MPDAFHKLVDRAIKQLNRPTSLAQCELIQAIPHTLAARRANWSHEPLGQPLSQELAQALNEVLNTAIENIGTPGLREEDQSREYRILTMQYARRMTVQAIANRLAIAEPTLFVHRKAGVTNVAWQLWERERLFESSGG